MNSVSPLGLLLYCRPGFEAECAAETERLAEQQGLTGEIQTQAQSGFVRFLFSDEIDVDWRDIAEALPYQNWVFARQRVIWLASIEDLPEKDRVTPIVDTFAPLRTRVGRIMGETADTNDAKQLSGFLRRVTPYLEMALGERNILRDDDKLPTLHLFFQGMQRVDIGLTLPHDASPWPMGIARLRMPRNAPSRSTLKLAEAFDALMTEEERQAGLRAGLRAVDLGAAPGGWSFQFAERGLHVLAIDNGPLADSVKATGMVEHLRVDGFTYRPRGKIEWMVCDMVEQPARIAALVADWVSSGRCRRSIFNLKLPMKKRLDELDRCRTMIHKRMQQQDARYVLRFKHLYHDREEVTGYLAKE